MANDISFYRGDSYPVQVTITDGTSPLDLTGASFLLTVNTQSKPTSIDTQLFQVVGVIDDNPLLGIVVFTPTVINTDQTPAKYYYDIQYTDASGNIRTIIKSLFTITMDITK